MKRKLGMVLIVLGYVLGGPLVVLPLVNACQQLTDYTPGVDFRLSVFLVGVVLFFVLNIAGMLLRSKRKNLREGIR